MVVRDAEGVAHRPEVFLHEATVEAIVAGWHGRVGREHGLPGDPAHRVGHHAEPQCRKVCPVDCIPLNPAFAETHEQLYAKYLRLTGRDKTASETEPSG